MTYIPIRRPFNQRFYAFWRYILSISSTRKTPRHCGARTRCSWQPAVE